MEVVVVVNGADDLAVTDDVETDATAVGVVVSVTVGVAEVAAAGVVEVTMAVAEDVASVAAGAVAWILLPLELGPSFSWFGLALIFEPPLLLRLLLMASFFSEAEVSMV